MERNGEYFRQSSTHARMDAGISRVGIARNDHNFLLIDLTTQCNSPLIIR
jgi:hypothetical protein